MDSETQAALAAVHRENPIVPLFLLKTFSILETADANIVCWSESGDSFIVLDPERFAADVIPTHFKHNKFSSFVRQLNFYGFRKVKGKLSFTGRSEQHSWEFRHPFFQQGKPALLADIRRAPTEEGEASQQPAVSAGETGQVEGLKQQVVDLTGKVSALTKAMEDMQRMMAQLTEGKSPDHVTLPQVEDMSAAVTDVETSPNGWDIGDDELLMTFLEDLNDGPLPPVQPSSELQKPSLKRGRSVDEVAAALEQPASQRAKTDASHNMLEDPLVVQAVANAIALTTQTAGATLSFEQYSSALSSILSAVGSAQSQAMAVAAAAGAAAELLAARNQIETQSSMSTMSLAVV